MKKIDHTENIESKQVYDIDKCVDLIRDHLITKNGKSLSPIYTRQCYIDNHNLIPLYQSIKYITSHLPNITLVERIYRVYNKQLGNVFCKQCNKQITKFDKFTTGFRSFCSYSCNARYNTPSKFLSEESRQERSKKLSQSRLGLKLNDDWKLKLKTAANNPKTINQKKSTCLLKYGTSNPGVLGAYSSRSAQEYIISLLQKRNIDTNLAYFKTTDKNEFWQMIYVPFLNKMKYFSYDLIVFSTKDAVIDKDLTKIDLVLEYNGPWHYTNEEILGVEYEPATPYKSNKFTKLQQFELDKLKLNHIRQFNPKEILVYWERTGLTENIFLRDF